MATTIVKTIGGTTPDYATITLWEAAIPANLVTNDEIWQGECRDVSFDEAQIDLGAGITADSTRYIVLTHEAGSAFNGIAGNGPVIDKVAGTTFTSGGHIIEITAKFTRIIEMEITNSQTAVATGINACVRFGGAAGTSEADESQIVRCIIHDAQLSTNDAYAVTSLFAHVATYHVINNIMYEVGGSSTVRSRGVECTIFGEPATWTIIGNTIQDCNRTGSNGSVWNISFRFDGGAASTLNAYNNICIQNETNVNADDVETEFTTNSTLNGSHNATSDATATQLGPNFQHNVVEADMFVDVGAGTEDFHLKSGSIAIGNGSDRGTTPIHVEIDIDGFDRDDGGVTWDIGADQATATLRPDATVAAGGWTAQPAGTLHGVTSDQTDTTYAESPVTPSAADILKLGMENPATTPTDPVTVRTRWRQD